MFDTIILLKDGDKMNKYKKIGILVIIVIIIAITYFCFFKGNLGEKAIKEVQKYVESQNISFDEFKFIELNELSSDLFDKCQQGSGVLVSKVDGKYEYKDVMKCTGYISEINSEKKLNGPEIIILNYNEEFIDLNENESVLIEESDNVKIIHYSIDSNSLKRIVIYTNDKTKNIDGSNNDYYPDIILNGDDKINVFYKSDYQELGFTASDKKDGDLTNLVKVDGNVDTKKIGSYTIKYYVFNSQNNYVIRKRTVNVVLNIINFKVDAKVEKVNNKDEANIILKITGSGYQYTKLPDGKINKEKDITYKVNKDDTYTFLIYDMNDEMIEKEINVNNIDTIPPTGSCKATFKRDIVNVDVKATDNGEIDTYTYLIDQKEETIKNNTYEYQSLFYKNRLPNVKVKIVDKAKNSTEITCENINNVIPNMYKDVNGYNCLEGFTCYKQRDYNTTYRATSDGPGPLSRNGCLPTSMSILVSGFGLTSKNGEVYTPPTLVNEVIYPDGKIWGYSNPERIEYIANSLGLKHQKYSLKNDFELLKNELRKGNVIVANVSRGCLALGGHFLTIIGINEKDEIFISDPDTKTFAPHSYNPSVCNHKVNTWDDVNHLKNGAGIQYFVVISK